MMIRLSISLMPSILLLLPIEATSDNHPWLDRMMHVGDDVRNQRCQVGRAAGFERVSINNKIFVYNDICDDLKVKVNGGTFPPATPGPTTPLVSGLPMTSSKLVPICEQYEAIRRIDGICNNMENPLWGSIGIPFKRLIPAKYQDDISEPYPECTSSVTTNCLPNARLVSLSIHPDVNVSSIDATAMVTQFGQFLDHDITLTPEEEFHHCCMSPEAPECMPINIPTLNDTFFSSVMVTCLDFSRSSPACNNTLLRREQMNGITAFVDASNVYGSDVERSRMLRSFVDGKLLTSTYNGYELLPQIRNNDTGELEYTAGDIRALEMPGLASMHTMFLREHNRICDGLKAVKDDLTDDELFYAARSILIGEMQNIVYYDYLPVILGETEASSRCNVPFGYSEYDSNVDPGIANSFATAAYRFGHSMIVGIITMLNELSGDQEGTFHLRDHYFNTANYLAYNGTGMDKLIYGLINTASMENDRFVTEETTNFLFPADGAHFGSDLVARNIQRGRDHGLPGYNAWRRHCNLSEASSWSSAVMENSDISYEQWMVLRELYNSPDDIDLFTAGLMESHVPGGVTGPTFNCLIAKQFVSLKEGDRFFYTHENQAGSFTIPQMNQLKNRRLTDIICENTNIETLRHNVFRMNSPIVNCTDRIGHQLDFQVFARNLKEKGNGNGNGNTV